MISIIGQTHYGLGKHALAFLGNSAIMDPLQKWTFAQSLLIVMGVSSVKVSVGLFLVRLSDRTVYTRFIWGVISKKPCNRVRVC
jgi:hypothetical protein